MCKSYNKSITALLWVGQYGGIFSSRLLYCPSLRSGQYCQPRTEYFPILPSQSCSNIYIKDTLKEDKPPYKGQAESTRVYTLYIKSPLKEDKPPYKGQAESTRVYTLYIKSPLKEDNLSTKGKPKVLAYTHSI